MESEVIDSIDLPGSIVMKDVSFENINTIVPFHHTGSTTQPGILSIEFFGDILLENITVNKASFSPDEKAEDSAKPVFLFDYVRKLTINGLSA